MKKFLRIVFWEFKTKIISKNFLFSTFFVPIIFIFIIYIPNFYIEKNELINLGIIDISENNIHETFNNYFKSRPDLQVSIQKVMSDSNEAYQKIIYNMNDIKFSIDTTMRKYNLIRYERDILYNKKKKSKEEKSYFLNLYETQNFYRNIKDSLEKELDILNSQRIKVLKYESQLLGDEFLNNGLLTAYMYFDIDFLKTGKVEYHSVNPGNFILKDRLEDLVYKTIIQKRLEQSNLNLRHVAQILSAVEISVFQKKGNQIKESRTYNNYYYPITALILLYISIFSSVGNLFSSLVYEKNHHILEFILGTTAKINVFFAKILGISFMGLLQIVTWILLLLLSDSLDLINLSDISEISIETLSYFIFYYFMGYFLFSGILSGLSVIYNNEMESAALNQLVRIMAIIPLLFALLILENPNSDIVRYLSFIPFLCPSFMVMRLPLSGSLPYDDIIITSILLLISIVLVFIASYRIFRFYCVYYGKKRPSAKEIFSVIRKGYV